ncbi:hypothetical protein B0I33_10951 [Prauserella shujinwangii]|uniref:Uncharacterized protein n=1 Tax=Prauserella shujinwangii TaxID=1453103 RepID=A0A2T0LPW2_9PSEU|nr:hypothetical protein [Prauserella shujinwangii]PRX45388.1 hypothetical protein B0I33_10951 [Prauserella shujinwangii]
MTRRLRLFATGDGLLLRVAAEHADLVRDFEHLPHEVRRRQTGAADWLDVLVVGVGSGGLLTVLAETLRRVLHRDEGTEIHVELPDGTKLLTKGVSVDELRRVLELARQDGE